MSDIPLECWTIDLGYASIKIDDEEANRVLKSLDQPTCHVIAVTDIYGCEQYVVRDSIYCVARYTVAAAAAARKRNRDYDAAIDALDPDGAEKEWDK